MSRATVNISRIQHICSSHCETIELLAIKFASQIWFCMCACVLVYVRASVRVNVMCGTVIYDMVTMTMFHMECIIYYQCLSKCMYVTVTSSTTSEIIQIPVGIPDLVKLPLSWTIYL